MSVTSGFYNSLNSDRKYNAEQMAQIFDGVISDGIFENYLDGMKVNASSGMNVQVLTGRCWFDHAWVYVSTPETITIPNAGYKYYIVVDIDHRTDVRAGGIKLLKGTASAYPSRTLSTNHNQYVLAKIDVPSGATAITQSMISDCRSDSDLCGYVTGILNSVASQQAAASAASAAALAQQYAEIAEDYNTNVVQRLNAQDQQLQDILEDAKDYSDAKVATYNELIQNLETDVETLYSDQSSYATKEEVDQGIEESTVWSKASIDVSASEILQSVEGAYQKQLKDSDGNLISEDGAGFDTYVKQTATGVTTTALGGYYTQGQINEKLSDYETTAALNETLEDYDTSAEVDAKLEPYAKTADLPDMDLYYTEEQASILSIQVGEISSTVENEINTNQSLVKTTCTLYCKSSSSTTAPDDDASWSGTYPTVDSTNKYVWVKYGYETRGGDTSYSQPVLENKGVVDAAIAQSTADNKVDQSDYDTYTDANDSKVNASYKSMTPLYLIGASATTAPTTGTWSTEYPTATTSNKYIWIKYECVPNVGEPVYTTPIVLNKGEVDAAAAQSTADQKLNTSTYNTDKEASDAKIAASFKSVDAVYSIGTSDSPDNADSPGSWSTSYPTTTDDKPYVWIRWKYTKNDETCTYSDYEIDAVSAQKEAQVYAKSKVTQLASSISTSLAAGGTYPIDGTDLEQQEFFEHKIKTFEDGTIDTVQSWALSDDYLVGGPNLLMDSDSYPNDWVDSPNDGLCETTSMAIPELYATHARTWGFNKVGNLQARLDTVTRDVCGTDYIVRVISKATETTTEEQKFWIGWYGQSSERVDKTYGIQVLPGEHYTFSFYARSNIANKFKPYFMIGWSSQPTGSYPDVYVGTDWTRYTWTWEAKFSELTAGTDYYTMTVTDSKGVNEIAYYITVFMGFIRPATSVVKNDEICMTGFKMEHGVKATEWRPNVSDTTSKAQLNAYNYTDETATEVKHEMWGEGSYAGGTYDMKHYTDETAQELVDQFRCVDGNNLLFDTDVSSLTAVAADYNRYTSNDSGTLNCESFESISSYIAGTQYAAKFDLSKFNHADGENHMTCWYRGNGVCVVPGETYTFSAYFKPTVAGIIPTFEFGISYYAICYEGTDNAVAKTYTIDSQLSAPANAWTKCYWTVQFPPYTGYTNYYTTATAGSETLYYTRIYMGCRVPNGSTLTSGYMYMTAPMFEKGAVAHEYKENTVYTNTSIRNAYMSSNVCKALIGDQWVSSLVSQTPESIDLTAHDITLTGEVLFKKSEDSSEFSDLATEIANLTSNTTSAQAAADDLNPNLMGDCANLNNKTAGESWCYIDSSGSYTIRLDDTTWTKVPKINQKTMIVTGASSSDWTTTSKYVNVCFGNKSNNYGLVYIPKGTYCMSIYARTHDNDASDLGANLIVCGCSSISGIRPTYYGDKKSDGTTSAPSTYASSGRKTLTAAWQRITTYFTISSSMYIGMLIQFTGSDTFTSGETPHWICTGLQLEAVDSTSQTPSSWKQPEAGEILSTKVVKSYQIYYCSSSTSTPAEPTSAVTNTATGTYNVWGLAEQKPKKGYTYFGATQYIAADGTVGCSAVEQLAHQTSLAEWCHSTDSAFIDGGDIYANTVTTDKLTVGLGVNMLSYYGDMSQIYCTTSNLSANSGQNLYMRSTDTSLSAIEVYQPLQSATVMARDGALTTSKIMKLKTTSESVTTGKNYWFYLGSSLLNTPYGGTQLNPSISYIYSFYYMMTSSNVTGKFKLRMYKYNSITDTSNDVTFSQCVNCSGDGSTTVTLPYKNWWTRAEIKFTMPSSFTDDQYYAHPIFAITPATASSGHGLYIMDQQLEMVSSLDKSASEWSPPSQTQINGGNIITDTITASKINVTDLKELGATMGGIYLTTNYVAGSNVDLRTSSINPSSDDTTTRYIAFLNKYGNTTWGGSGTTTKAFGVAVRTYGSSGNTYDYPFYVTYAGKLTATNAVITGEIKASTMTVSGYYSCRQGSVTGTITGYLGTGYGPKIASEQSSYDPSVTNTYSMIMSTKSPASTTTAASISSYGSSVVLNSTSACMYGASYTHIAAGTSITLAASTNVNIMAGLGYVTMGGAGNVMIDSGAEIELTAVSAATLKSSSDAVYITQASGKSCYIGISTSGVRYIVSQSTGDGDLQLGWNNTSRQVSVHATNLYIDGTSVYSSDRRLKQNIEYKVPNIIDQLKPVTFEYKKKPGVTRYGFIAQDVEEVIPELVSRSDTSTWCEEEIKDVYDRGESWKYTDPIYSLSYNDIIALLVDKCQSLQKQIDEIRER